MCPEATGELRVALADVDESVLEKLLAVALVQASADEVTPPLGSTPSWNPERIAWFRAYHRAAAAGLDGPAREKTWAVVAGGTVMGSVRLKSCRPNAAEPASAARGWGGWPSNSWQTKRVLVASPSLKPAPRQETRLHKPCCLPSVPNSYSRGLWLRHGCCSVSRGFVPHG